MEENKKIEKGDRDTFYIKDGGAIFGIAFDKIFGQPLIAEHNDFEMSAKRNFKNLSETILSTFEEIFLNEGGRFDERYAMILFEMLNAKSNVMVKSPMLFSDFLKILDTVIGSADNLLLETVKSYVENNYALELDSATEESKAKNRKVNESLQFTDEHAKTLLKICYLYRIMIPLISVYFTYNKDAFSKLSADADEDTIIDEEEDYELEEMNSAVFTYLFEKFAAENSESLKNKLYKLVHSRISRTAYSDKRFWAAAKNVSITIDTEALEIYRKLLTNVIPKLSLDGDKNVVSFFQSVINNQINFLLQNKFKYKMVPIKENQRDSDDDSVDDMTEFEKMELRQIRLDEGSFLIRKKNNEDIIEILQEEFDVGVEDIEVKEIEPKIKRNKMQETILAMLTFKYFGDNQAIKYLNFHQYCKILLICKKFLEVHKFIYLPQLLVAYCEKHKERASISGKKVRPEILASKKYQDLISNKFKFFSSEIEKPFLSFVGSLYSSIFRDENGDEILDSTVKVGKVAEEIIDLAEFI